MWKANRKVVEPFTIQGHTFNKRDYVRLTDKELSYIDIPTNKVKKLFNFDRNDVLLKSEQLDVDDYNREKIVYEKGVKEKKKTLRTKEKVCITWKHGHHKSQKSFVNKMAEITGKNNKVVYNRVNGAVDKSKSEVINIYGFKVNYQISYE